MSRFSFESVIYIVPAKMPEIKPINIVLSVKKGTKVA